MIYDGVNTKPPIEELYSDYLEHGWLKDKAHKYIDRWKGKNGKWYYRYYHAKNTVKRFIDDRKKKKEEKLKKKQKKDWETKGRKKAYKSRKKDIAAARSNANAAYKSGKRTSQYYTSAERRKDISRGRTNAKNSMYKKSIKKYTEKKRKSLNNQPWGK